MLYINFLMAKTLQCKMEIGYIGLISSMNLVIFKFGGKFISTTACHLALVLVLLREDYT
jgi:hypothetical protein